MVHVKVKLTCVKKELDCVKYYSNVCKEGETSYGNILNYPLPEPYLCYICFLVKCIILSL